jgi:2-oxoisovalerate dehydrogenase E2 component (dihydrolipoyl transacylase)
VGDKVTEDQPLADMMTDKATVEMESPVSGIVTKIAGDAGDVIAIGAMLVEIELDSVVGNAAVSKTKEAEPKSAVVQDEDPLMPEPVAMTEAITSPVAPAAEPFVASTSEKITASPKTLGSIWWTSRPPAGTFAMLISMRF